MLYKSTRSTEPASVSSAQAIKQGLADDGGLTDKAACRVITLRLGKDTVTAGRYRITGGAVLDTV